MKKNLILMSCLVLFSSLFAISSCGANEVTNNDPGTIYYYNVDGKIHFNDDKTYFICELENSEVTCPVNAFITSVYDANNKEIGSFADEKVKNTISEGEEMIGGLYYVTNENNDFFGFPFSVMRLQYKK
jgi:hypothetical protein